jgi:VWFA-related protein
MRRAILAFLVFFALVHNNLAQTPQPGPPPPIPSQKPAVNDDDVVKITTNLVQVDAVVLKDGKVVRNLQKEDFEIFEDGRRQEITSFAYISNTTDAPSTSKPTPNPSTKDANGVLVPVNPLRPNETRRTIALVFDDYGLTSESATRVRKRLQKFVDQEVAANDLVAVIRTSGTMGALQQFTNDKRALNQAIEKLTYNQCSRAGLNVFNRGPISIPLCSQGNYALSLKALGYIADAMGYLPGRKSMIVFSDSLPIEEQEVDFAKDGSDTSNADPPKPATKEASDALRPATNNYKALLNRVAERAIRSTVVIYAVDAKGLVFTGATAADSLQISSRDTVGQANNLFHSRSAQLLQQREGADLIAKQTGGFLVRNSNSMELDRIVEDQSGYYLIGYKPSEETFNKSFHKIKAQVKKSDMTVRTRNGFYGISEEEAKKSKPQPTDKMMLALLSPFSTQDIAIDLTAFFSHNPKTGSIIRSVVHLNPKDLVFNESPDGSRTANVEFRSIVFGNNGEVVDKQTVGRSITISRDSYQEALRDGFSVILDTPVKRPGAYQFRIAARDAETSKIGASGQFISIPNLENHKLAISGVVMQPASVDPSTGINPYLKRFRAGVSAGFSFAIYNATLDTVKKQPNVTVQARLYSDEKVLFSSPDMLVDATNQPDLTHLLTVGTLKLSSTLEPGAYALQVLVTDNNAKDKPSVMQWVNFEIVK